MNVGELRQRLKGYSDDLPVLSEDDAGRLRVVAITSVDRGGTVFVEIYRGEEFDPSPEV